MKTILVYTTQFMPTGGIESHLKEFCKHMSKAGYLIDLVVLNSKMAPETKQFFNTFCRNVYLGEKKRSANYLWFTLQVLFKIISRSYQIVYTNGQGNSIRLLGKLCLRKSKWIHHHHTAGDESDQATWTPAYYKALKEADEVIACSNRNASLIQHVLQRDIQYVPCFSRQLPPKKDEFSKKDNLRFGYFGRLIPAKGIDTICKLSKDADIKNIEFHIWGSGDSYPSSFFKNFPNVKFHGAFKTDEELSEIISSIDGFLLFSSYVEGLPISLLEVMSAGIPWIATDMGGISDIAVDEVSTTIIPSNVNYDRIRSAVMRLADNIRSTNIDYSLQINFYQQHFSSIAITNKWIHLFN